LKASLFETYVVHVKRHASLNSFSVFVSIDSLDGISVEDILSAFADQFISKLIRKGNDKPFSFQTVFFIFEVFPHCLAPSVGCEMVPL
jgi:hypothetical protein